MNDLIDEITEIASKPFLPIPKSWRLFLISGSRFFYLNEKMRSYGDFVLTDDFQNVHERGVVLDKFAKFEFLIDQLVTLVLAGIDFNKRGKIQDVTDKQSVRTKTELLHKWKLIDSDLRKLITKLFEVRNQLAHNFDESEAYYDDNYLSTHTSWKSFKEDLEKAWGGVVKAYQNEQKNVDFDNLKKQFQTLSENKP